MFIHWPGLPPQPAGAGVQTYALVNPKTRKMRALCHSGVDDERNNGSGEGLVSDTIRNTKSNTSKEVVIGEISRMSGRRGKAVLNKR